MAFLAGCARTLDRRAPAVVCKSVPIARWSSRANHRPKTETPATPLRRRLERVSAAWDRFQANRARDAVYGYLGAVFEIVVHYRVRRKTKKLLRSAFEFAGLPLDRNADSVTAIIRCTCERDLGDKTISKWARALRYVTYCEVPSAQLEAFMKEAGGERHGTFLTVPRSTKWLLIGIIS